MTFPVPTPSRGQSQEVFDSAVGAFMDYLPTFEADVTAMALAMNLNDTTDTSVSSVLIGTGAKTFAVTAGKSFQPGMYLVVADVAAPSTNSMVGQVTSYSGTALVVDSKTFRGSGTIASWVISQSAAAADIAQDIHASPEDTTPDDADELGIWDSVTGLLGKITIAGLKSLFALINGDPTKTFSVAPATSGTMAPPLAQTIGKNIVINGGFTINQRAYVSAAVLASAAYGHDRWKAGSGGGDYSFTQLNSNTQITIAASKTLIQVIEDKNVQGTQYILSWAGTCTARYAVNSATPAGAYAASPIIITGQTAGTTMSIEFGNGAASGTLGTVQLEQIITSQTAATTFEQRPYGYELSLCQRYNPYLTFANGDAVGMGSSINATQSVIKLILPVTPRVAPTGVQCTDATKLTIRNGSNVAGVATSFAAGGYSANLSQTVVVSGTAGVPTIAAGDGCQCNTDGAVSIYFTGCEL